MIVQKIGDGVMKKNESLLRSMKVGKRGEGGIENFLATVQ